MKGRTSEQKRMVKKLYLKPSEHLNRNVHPCIHASRITRVRPLHPNVKSCNLAELSVSCSCLSLWSLPSWKWSPSTYKISRAWGATLPLSQGRQTSSPGSLSLREMCHLENLKNSKMIPLKNFARIDTLHCFAPICSLISFQELVQNSNSSKNVSKQMLAPRHVL